MSLLVHLCKNEVLLVGSYEQCPCEGAGQPSQPARPSGTRSVSFILKPRCCIYYYALSFFLLRGIYCSFYCLPKGAGLPSGPGWCCSCYRRVVAVCAFETVYYTYIPRHVWHATLHTERKRKTHKSKVQSRSLAEKGVITPVIDVRTSINKVLVVGARLPARP